MKLLRGGFRGWLGRSGLGALILGGAGLAAVGCGSAEPLDLSSGTGGGGQGAGTSTGGGGNHGGGGAGGETTATGGSGGNTGSGGSGGNAAAALFSTDGIARFDLTLGKAAIDALAVDSATYVHGDAEVTLANGQKLSLPNIGARLKGKYGSFRTLEQKAAFLLKFDKYEDGQKLLGLGKLALNNMVQDPSMIHEQLAYTLFRAADVPAPRTAYARVFVNGELYGLYATVEVLDNAEYLQTWYGDDSGNLYEGAYGSDLENGLLGTFDQDRGDDIGYADLQELTDALDAMTTPETFLEDANTVIDMDRYLQFAATEIFIGHWDGYAWTRNNYYIYRGPDQRWAFMPWGTDQTFGDYLGIWGGGGRIEQMCAQSLPCRQKLKSAFAAVAARVTSLALVGRADVLHALISDAVQEDPRKEYDSGTVDAYIQGTKDYLSNRPGDVTAQFICANPFDVDDDGDGAPGCGYDCDDGNPTVYPGAPELCNLRDDNCNGQLDDDPSCPACIEMTPGGGLTFAFCFHPLSFAEAEADCAAQGGHLASIPDQLTQNSLADAAFSISGGQWWIGLSDQATEGTFTWEDGTPLVYQNWAGGEPNDANQAEDCAHLADWAGGQWNDIGCETASNYVCKLP